MCQYWSLVLCRALSMSFLVAFVIPCLLARIALVYLFAYIHHPHGVEQRVNPVGATAHYRNDESQSLANARTKPTFNSPPISRTSLVSLRGSIGQLSGRNSQRRS